MKKKILYFLAFIVVVTLTTGCVKFNTNVKIGKDKSMDFSVIYAANTSLLGKEELLDKNTKSELEKKGFTVSDYSDDSMRGFKISLNVKNIDFISTKDDVKFNLSDLLDDKSKIRYVFKVKKGLFKNRYTANVLFDASTNSLGNNNFTDFNDSDTVTDNNILSDNDSSDDYLSNFIDNSDFDWSSLASSMDLSFNVELPYSAKDSNATSTNNDNKNLKWNLSSTKTQAIKFEFELYNMITIGIIVLAIGVMSIVLSIIFVGKRNVKKNNDSGMIVGSSIE